MADDNDTKTSGRGRPAVSPARREAMQRQIAEAAQRLFSSEGYSQVSMRRIAAEVGCAPMTLYKYYDAKIDILRTLWGGVFEDVFAHMDKTPAGATDALAHLSTAYVSYWLDHPEQYRLVFMAKGVTQPDVSLFVDNPDIAGRFRVFTDAILNAHGGKMDAADLKAKQDALICFLNGIAHNKITISGYQWAELDELVAIAVTGVLGK